LSTVQRTEADEWKYAEKTLTWSGWGSPVGLGLFLVSVGAFIVLLSHAGIWR